MSWTSYPRHSNRPPRTRSIRCICHRPKRWLKAFDAFNSLYEAKYPKACECLRKDRDVLFSFYDFPAAHWQHLRTTNPVESTFATVRLRTERTKGCGSRLATLTMVWHLTRAASTG